MTDPSDVCASFPSRLQTDRLSFPLKASPTASPLPVSRTLRIFSPLLRSRQRGIIPLEVRSLKTEGGYQNGDGEGEGFELPLRRVSGRYRRAARPQLHRGLRRGTAVYQRLPRLHRGRERRGHRGGGGDGGRDDGDWRSPGRRARGGGPSGGGGGTRASPRRVPYAGQLGGEEGTKVKTTERERRNSE